MNQPIKSEDIRAGDTIRWEREADNGAAHAVEYVTTESLLVWNPFKGKYYLLDRPVPPFEPYWGMVIVNPQNEERAVYVPDGKYDHSPWLATVDGLFNDCAETDSWAKQKLTEGWVIIEKPEGVQ